MTTFKHIVGIVLIVLIGIGLTKPEILLDPIGISTRAVESVTTRAHLGQLIPSAVVSYLDAIDPVTRRSDDNPVLTIEEIIDATNKERIKEGLPPLRSNPNLIQSARAKTNDMIAQHYFEHESPDGTQVWDLATTAGYQYVIVGENLARGDFADADDLVREWSRSPGHRANMLSPKYQEMGAYAAVGIHEGQEVWFAVQHFGTERSACPTIDTKLKLTIDSLDKDLSQRRAQIANEKAALIAPNHPQGEEYKERVTAFNALVAEYNTALVISQEKIKVYNAQVAAFNACLNAYKPVS